MRADLTQLAGARFDVAVIGGGINGASAAQELAAAGYRTLVVDKGDFGTGASSRSSRLLHCGLRYLAPGRSLMDFVRHPTRFLTALRMARLAMDARAEFVETSPHRTSSITLHFPIYRDGPYRAWQVDAAFALLQRLGGKEVPLEHRSLTRDEIRAHPLIGGLRDQDSLVGVAAFREYQFDWPERVALDAILDAERLGGVVRNHTRAHLVERRPEGGWTVELTDELTSAATRVEAAVVLVMAGAWIDDVLRGANPQAGRKIFGTKGCHLLVKLPDSCAGAGIATLNSAHEPLYCIPWKQFHYFGPTETPYEGDPDRVFVTEAEADGLLTEANRLLPGLRLTRDDIRLSWAGVRPLTYDPAVPFGNRSRILHDLAGDGLPDAFAMTGGPVMTHRSAGRELAERVAQRLKPSGAPRAPSYAPPASGGLEHAARVSDLMFRRRGIAWSGEPAPDAVTSAAEELGDALGWDAARIAEEAARFTAEWNDLYAPPHRRRDTAALAAAAE